MGFLRKTLLKGVVVIVLVIFHPPLARFRDMNPIVTWESSLSRSCPKTPSGH